MSAIYPFIRCRHRLCLMLPVLLLLCGCIKNDIPYPRIPQLILSIAAEGETREAEIDSVNFSATVFLDEQVDIRAVRFSEFSYSEGAEVSKNLLEGTFDLSSPMIVDITKYQTYQWAVTAQQPIERYFRIDGQFGETVIDAVGRRVVVRVPDYADLADLTLTAVKLGQAGVSVMSPDLKPGKIDLSRPMVVTVTAFGRSEEWTIYVEKTEVSVQTVSADAWAKVIWAYASAQSDAKVGFQYRKSADDTWIDVPEGNISGAGGSFSCRIDHLEPLTEYVVRAKTDEETANSITVNTEATLDLPDGDFENWWLNGKVWCPWAEGGERFWDTGNKGASIAGPSNVSPSDFTPMGSGKSAKLESLFAGVFGIGKLAAGSVFTGEFIKVDGTNGVLAFGRLFSARPTKLKGYFKYNPKPIDLVQSPCEYMKGKPDSCQIYIALTDWDQPKEIRTNPKNRQLFDIDDPKIIAYGQMTVSRDMSAYEPFEIELEYRSTSRKPRYIQVTVSSSKYGDYFTGGTGTVLYVDQFSLDYDY